MQSAHSTVGGWSMSTLSVLSRCFQASFCWGTHLRDLPISMPFCFAAALACRGARWPPGRSSSGHGPSRIRRPEKSGERASEPFLVRKIAFLLFQEVCGPMLVHPRKQRCTPVRPETT